MQESDSFGPHFTRAEFACQCGCGFDTVDVELATVVVLARQHFGVPVIITSGCRCETHNINEGGAENSFHPLGKAADCYVSGVSPQEVADFFDQLLGARGGIKVYLDRVHVDVRSGYWRAGGRWDS